MTGTGAENLPDWVTKNSSEIAVFSSGYDERGNRSGLDYGENGAQQHGGKAAFCGEHRREHAEHGAEQKAICNAQKGGRHTKPKALCLTKLGDFEHHRNRRRHQKLAAHRGGNPRSHRL